MVYTPTRPHAIYQILVALDGVNPTIWRLLDIPATSTLAHLHHVLQWAMGWEQKHPYYFQRGEIAYVDLPASKQWSLGPVQDANEVVLEKIFGRRGRYLEYIYDLSDDWRHHIWLENVFLAKPHRSYPRLVDGAGACPPEDFGGAPRYQATLNDQPTKEPKLPQDFDPTDFDAEPRPFPDAEVLIYDSDQYTADQQFPEFDAQALDMLGELTTQTLNLIESAPDNIRRDLRRAIEDLMLADDCLPPRSNETFEHAWEQGLPVDKLLVDVVLHHDQLRERYSLAPLHAAWLLSFWPLPQTTDTFWTVLTELDAYQEGSIDTMIDALTRSAKGRQRLLNGLHTLDEALQLRVIETLLEDGERDERFLPILKASMEKHGRKNPTAPYLLTSFGGPQARAILNDALKTTLEPISDDRRPFSDEELADQAEYAHFLATMLLQAGGAIEPEQQGLLDDLESFFSDALPPAPT